MRRLLTIAVFFSMISLSAISQTDKGWRSVGGTGMLRLDFKTPSTYFTLQPELYWFVANKFAIGTDFGFSFSSVKTNDSNSAGGVNAFIAPGIRYYFRDTEKKWRPYLFGNGGFEVYSGHQKVNNVKSSFNGSGFTGYAGAGLDWFFNEHAAFDVRLHLIDYTRETAEFNPTFTIGLQAYFHHD